MNFLELKEIKTLADFEKNLEKFVIFAFQLYQEPLSSNDLVNFIKQLFEELFYLTAKGLGKYNLEISLVSQNTSIRAEIEKIIRKLHQEGVIRQCTKMHNHIVLGDEWTLDPKHSSYDPAYNLKVNECDPMLETSYVQELSSKVAEFCERLLLSLKGFAVGYMDSRQDVYFTLYSRHYPTIGLFACTKRHLNWLELCFLRFHNLKRLQYTEPKEDKENPILRLLM
jgi:hypothetical protein